MLILKTWMETRWRLLALAAYLLISLGVGYANHAATGIFGVAWLKLTVFAVVLGGCGIRSQAPIGPSEGLAASTQFTLSLPVSRLRLLASRATAGLIEVWAATAVFGCLAWGGLPSLREATTAADFARLVLTTMVFLSAPYCAHVFFETWLEEPASMVAAALAVVVLLALGREIAPAVDVFRAFGPASPLVTHRLPWEQMAVSAGIACGLLLAAVQVARRREY